jgi:hypothetical protein
MNRILCGFVLTLASSGQKNVRCMHVLIHRHYTEATFVSLCVYAVN